MKKAIIFCLFLCIIPVTGLIADAGIEKYIPETSTAVISLNNMQKDPGLNWLYKSWIGSPREDSTIRPFITPVGLKNLSVAILPVNDDNPFSLLIIMELVTPSKIDKEKMNKIILKQNMINEGAELKTIEYKGTSITYVHNSPIKFELSAYCIIDNIVLFATEPELLKKSLDGPDISKSKMYKNCVSDLKGGQDCFYFANNNDARFASFLKPMEKKWKLSLLLSVDDLLWMGSSFDVVDSNKATGEIVFLGADKANMEDIIDDAEFIGEAFKRKFTAEKIEYTSKVEVKENKVTLTFEVSGLEPLWTSLFVKGVMNTLLAK